MIIIVEGIEKIKCKNLRGIRLDYCSKEFIFCERILGLLIVIKSIGDLIFIIIFNWFEVVKECYLLKDL